MTKNRIEYRYDAEADVLYLSLGKSRRAKTVEMGAISFFDSTLRPVKPLV
jgi:hypothetical protein